MDHLIGQEVEMRLTAAVRKRLLEQNDGFTTTTYNERKNFRESRDYEIRDGAVYVRARGKTSWADSDFGNEWMADDEEVHRFLYNNLSRLDTDGIE